MRGDMAAHTCVSFPLKGVLLQKYFPMAVCLLGGFYILLYSGMMLRSFSSVCIIKREIGPNTYEIEDPVSSGRMAPEIKVHNLPQHHYRKKSPPKVKVPPGGEAYHEAAVYADEDSVDVALSEEDEDFDIYPDPSLEKYGLTEDDCNCSRRFESMDVKIKYLCLGSKDHSDVPTLLTMFTTMADDPGRTNVHRNTIHMWKKLGPRVRTIMFVTCNMIDSPAVEEACRVGWDIVLVPSCDMHDMPVLKTMFMAARTISSNSGYYGYANADILFTEALIDTLDFLQLQIQKTKQFEQNLIIGGKTNLEVDSTLYINSIDQIKNLSKGLDSAFVTFVDYFISSNDGFPWEAIPQLVIGRRGYDNWLVKYARKNKIATFDATETILAAHQGGPGISWVPHSDREGADINLKLIGRNADLLEGLISCTKFTIRPDSRTRFGLYWRKKAGFCGQKMWSHRTKWKDLMAKDGLRKIRLRT